MNHYCARHITWTLSQLAVFRNELEEQRKQQSGGKKIGPAHLHRFQSLLKDAREYTFAAGFIEAWERLSIRYMGKAQELSNTDISTLIGTIESIELDIYKEMKSRHFLLVAPDRVGFLEKLPDVFPFNAQIEFHAADFTFWGNGENCAIESARPDIKEAGNCLAAECNTAAVFHAMRASEHAIRTLARRVKVSLTDKRKPLPIEYATWEKIIRELKNRIDRERQKPQGKRRNERLSRYSDLADQCVFLKDLWRNDVMHARGQYNRNEAHGVLDRVRQFIHLVEEVVQ
jgi:hypothetical protein